MPSRAAGLALVLIAAFPIPSLAATGTTEWSRSFAVTGRATIVVRTNGGRVHVSEGEAKSVTVQIHTRGWRIGRQVRVDARQEGARIEIEAREPRWNMGLTFSFQPGPALEIDVAAPRESDLEITSGDGGVVVERIVGHIRVETGDGGIRADQLRGDVRLHTNDGRIQADGLDGRLAASTGDGSVRVSGRFDALEVETGDGRVVVEAEPGSTVGSGWSIESGDGAVTLRLAASIAADLDARTRDGRIDLGIPVSVSGGWERHEIHGSLNGGGATIRLRTGDGPIRLERL